MRNWKETNTMKTYEVESMNNAINENHSITRLATIEGMTTEEVYNKVGGETTEEMYNRLFDAIRYTMPVKVYEKTGNKAETEKDNIYTCVDWTMPDKEYKEEEVINYITDCYINLTKGIIKKMAYGVIKKVCKDGHISYMPHSTYKTAMTIISDKGVILDNFFFQDLSQECFITLFENVDSIEYDGENKTFNIGTVVLDCYKSIRGYLYRNKARQDNTECELISYDEDNDEFISIAVNTIDYRRYAIANYNDECTSTMELMTICGLVLDYIRRTEKGFISDKCKLVLTGLLKGFNINEISKTYNISRHSVTKYRNILNNAYYEVYKKPIIKDELTSTCYTSYYPSNGTFTIDFKGLKGVIDNNSRDTVLERVNAFYHARKQAFYNELFSVPVKSKIDNTDYNEYRYNLRVPFTEWLINNGIIPTNTEYERYYKD